MKKHILFYAHYYIPDVASTGQILKELAEGLLDEFKVTIICVVPSYGGTIEDKYKTQRFYKENINGVDVFRIRVPEFTKKKKLSRIKNILSYYFGARKATKMVGEVDYVFSISQPPILGGMLGLYGKKKLRAKFIYNIQDFNPEQIMAVNYSSNKAVIKIMMALDKKSCKNSDLVITVGRDLVETIHKRFKGEKEPNVALINNWIDEKAIHPLERDNNKVKEFKERYGLNEKFVIMYSGNIGLYYDLENLIKVMEQFDENTKSSDGRSVVFAFVGDGGMLNNLKDYVNEKKIKNIVFIPYQAKENLIYSLNAADVHWCVNSKGIKGVSCPSKGYGIMATGKPVIGVLEKGSEIRCLIDDSACGLCCEPADYIQIKKIISIFINMTTDNLDNMGRKGREYLDSFLTKDVSIRKYKTIIETM